LGLLMRRLAPAAALAAVLVLAAPAGAATRFYIRGAGFGHGVGMSQYGAQGFAEHGWGYATILRHYYTGTRLGVVDAGWRVRVLLSSPRTARVGHVSWAGPKRLTASRRYAVRATGGGLLELRTSGGRRVARFTSPLVLRGPRGWTRLGGAGYRGSLQIYARAGGRVDVVNVLGLDAYVRGVVAREMPASWAQEALRVQAVAARTYAVTTGAGRLLYPDTRSQVYGGMGAETASVNAAVAATRGQVVTYAGRPVVTYFFSTSGGHTENVENSFLGAEPQPWLRGVDDPYDGIAPRHRWTFRRTTAWAQARLGRLVKGRFRGIKVLRRGASPRIVRAQVLGTRGRTTVTGPTLRSRFDAYDTWMRFSTISSRAAAAASGGGVRASAVRRDLRLGGSVLPGRRGTRVRIERWTGRRWVVAGATRLAAGGRFAWSTGVAGRYRAVIGGLAGPTVVLARPEATARAAARHYPPA
jgi:stage II sporulation protein D